MTEIICLIHDRPEPDLPGDFRACGECWHVWRRESDFREDLAEAEGEVALTMDLDLVFTCPLCAHDF